MEFPEIPEKLNKVILGSFHSHWTTETICYNYRTASSMRILVYKQTHLGDPDATGRFGVHGCMGRVRGYKFDAVIGVGGKGAGAMSSRIAGKISWVGVGAYRRPPMSSTPLVTFKAFRNLVALGYDLHKKAPLLAKRMYGNGARILIVKNTDVEYREALNLLRFVKLGVVSSYLPVKASNPKCKSYPANAAKVATRNRCGGES